MLICTNKISYITRKCLSRYSVSQMLSPSILIGKSWLATSRKDKIDVPIGFKSKDLKLRKVVIPDDRDDLLSSLTLNDKDELLTTREIGEYWIEKLPKRHIHVLAKREKELKDLKDLEQVREKLNSEKQQLLEENASLKEKLSKSEYGTYKF